MSRIDDNSLLNAAFFENILREKHENISLVVNEVKVEKCVGLSAIEISRCFVVYELDLQQISESFVVKQYQPSNQTNKHASKIHTAEMNFYRQIAPKMEMIFERFEEIVFPKTISIDDEFGVIVLEDVAKEQFVSVDRTQGLNELQIKLTLKKLSKFHAASLLIHEANKDIFKSFNYGVFSNEVKPSSDALPSTFDVIVEEVSTWKGFEHYAEKLSPLKGNFLNRRFQCFVNDPGEFCVLNHGDLWANNLMFKHGTDGEFVDVVLIDYQLSHWASPAMDLNHFLYTSCNDECFTQPQIESFVQFYYLELRDALNKLSYDMTKLPTLKAFEDDFANKLFYGFVCAITVLPYKISAGIDKVRCNLQSRDDAGTNFRKAILRNTRYQAIAKRMLPIFDEKGIFD